MKKVALFLVAGMLIATMSACGAKSTSSEASEPESSSVMQESPESTPEETTEPETETEPESKPTNGTATIVTSDTLEEVGTESGEIRGGTNQNDAVLLPMNTKLYGTVQDGAYSWFAFTTGERQDATYRITFVNKTINSYDLYAGIYDASGKELKYGYAESNGIASTIESGLESNTTYYLVVRARDNHKDVIDYRLIIKDPAEQPDAYNTADTLSEARGVMAALEGEIYPGTNQDDSAMIPTGAKIAGTVQDGIFAWFAFETNGVENATYSFTTVNETLNSYDLYIGVFDEYGKELEYGYASNNGIASTMSVELDANTTYYLGIRARDYHKDVIYYTVSIQAPKEPEAQTATIEQLEDDLVFETPFELNSTQVMFVANKAVFIDENAAKEALKPVADVILAHPDHPILLAGTTATDGTQESCVDLSNRRAAAVKDLLVSAFGVPESQIQTIGLGYEADPFVRGKDRDANGKFVETEGAKNRRVVVLDIDDPIAKELLGQ